MESIAEVRSTEFVSDFRGNAKTYRSMPNNGVLQTSFIKADQVPIARQLGTGASSEADAAIHPVVVEEALKDQDARAYFLAKRYAGESSVEDDARFHMLTQRLRRLVPRVSAADLALLDSDVTLIEESSALLAQIRAGLEDD